MVVRFSQGDLLRGVLAVVVRFGQGDLFRAVLGFGWIGLAGKISLNLYSASANDDQMSYLVRN